MTDGCEGIVAETKDGEELKIHAEHTIFASGGIGGCYEHSTNFPHLTGDALDISEKHHITSGDIWIMCRYIRQHFIQKNREDVS